MSNRDPITRLIEDTNRPEVAKKVAKVKAACRLTDEERQEVLAASLTGDGSWLIKVVEHFRAMSFYDGMSAGINAACDTIQSYQHRDDGDATAGTLPLVKLGQGDYTREVNP